MNLLKAVIFFSLFLIFTTSVAAEKNKIINKLNTYFGFRAIGRIKIIQGPIPSPERKLTSKIRSIAKTDKIELERKLTSIKDPDLRVALAALGTAIIKK